VLPAYLANSIGALARDPFASACMPALMLALLPYLHHIQPASAQLLQHVATAAQQAKQLAAVLHISSQVNMVTLQVLHSLIVLVRLVAAG